MNSQLIRDALNITPDFSGRLLLHFMNGEYESSDIAGPDKFLASVPEFIEIAEIAGFTVTPVNKTGK